MESFKMFENGYQVGDKFIIGKAFIITHDEKFPESVPPIVDKAIKEKTNKIVVYEKYDDHEVLHVSAPVNHVTEVYYMRIGDGYLPLIKPAAAVATRNYSYHAFFMGFKIIGKKYRTDNDISWSFTARMGDKEVYWSEKYNSHELLKILQKVSEFPQNVKTSVIVPRTGEYQVFDTVPDGAKIIKYEKVPSYKVVKHPMKANRKIITLGTSNEIIFDEKNVHEVSPDDLDEIYKWVHVEHFSARWAWYRGLWGVHIVSPPDLERLPKFYKNVVYVNYESTNDMYFGTLDGKIHGQFLFRTIDEVPDIEKLFGNEYKNVQNVIVNDDTVRVHYKNENKEFVMTFEYNLSNYTITGYIPDFTALRRVRGVRFEEVVGEKLLKGHRKKFPTGPIPYKKVEKVIADDEEIKFVFGNYALGVNKERVFTIYRITSDGTLIEMMSGRIDDPIYIQILDTISKMDDQSWLELF